MVITSPSVNSNGKPPTKTYAESSQGISTFVKKGRRDNNTFIVVMPTRFCAVSAEFELAFVDAVDFADDAAGVLVKGVEDG